MSQPLYFEDLRVGDQWKSLARTITETDVIAFAGLTGDYDPLHVDREYVKQTPFGKPIAHGLLGLSFVAGLGSHFPMVHTVAFVALRNWEFVRPAFIGDTVHAVNEIAELRENGRRRGVVLWKRELVNQKGEIVQQGIFETLVAKSPAPSAKNSVAKSSASKTATTKTATTKTATVKSTIAKSATAKSAGTLRRDGAPEDISPPKPHGARRRSKSSDKES